MGEATIALVMKAGVISAQTKFRQLNEGDIANIMAHLDMIKQEFLDLYTKNVVKQKGEIP